MFTKEEYAHSLERTYRISGFQNAGRWFGLVYRSLRFSMLLNSERRDSIRKQRRELLAAWKEFASRYGRPQNNCGEKDTAQEYKADVQVIEQFEKVIRDNGLSFKESTELFRLARFSVFNEGEPFCRRPILKGR